MAIPIFVPVTLNDGPNSGLVMVPFVDVLPLQPTSSRVLILDAASGPLTAGMYVYDSTDQLWRFEFPMEAVSLIIVNSDDAAIYMNVMTSVTLPANAALYRNGVLLTTTTIPANDGAIYASRIPKSGSQGGLVDTVNQISPDVFGNVEITADDISGISTVGKTGSYADLTGKPAPYSLPVAQAATLGGVMVPASSSIAIDSAGNIDLGATILAKINGAVTSVVSSGSGSSIFRSQTLGVVTLNSIAAGSNVTIIDDGAGTLTIASTGGGTPLVPATATTLGGVIVPTTSDIAVDAQGNIDLSMATKMDINERLKLVAPTAGGVGLVLNNNLNVATLKSLVAGSNITLTDNGAGLVTIDAATGVATVTLTGDVTGSGSSSILTTLASTGVVPGTYNKLTVDAKGRVVAAVTATTLIDLGVTTTYLPTGGGSLTGTVTLTSGAKVTGLPDPVASTDAANKEYVDNAVAAIANGVSWRAAVDVATTGQLTLSGAQSVDGYSVVAGSRVLVKNQTLPSENGIYNAASGAWTRAADTDTGAELWRAAVLVVNGTVGALTQWANTNVSAPNVGFDAVTFGQLKGAGNQYIAGTGLALSGLTFSIADTGVTAGQYNKVTVNAQGQVTGGGQLTTSDLTTILGYTPYNGSANPLQFVTGTQQLTITGDATGNGTLGSSIPLTLSASGVSAGTYTRVTVDAKGRVTAGAQLGTAEIVTALGYTPINKAGDMMAGALNWASMVTLASAATVNVAAAPSNIVQITGNTTITGFDSGTGAMKIVLFNATGLTLTNSSSFLLPTGANIITQAGDTAVFVSTGGANWRCWAYQRADGTALQSSGSPFSTLQEFNGSGNVLAARFANIAEKVNVQASNVTTVYANLGSVTLCTANATANWVYNLRHSTSALFDTVMNVGDSVTLAVITQQGPSAFYPTAVQVDGTVRTVVWQGGAPTGGNANGRDVYTFTVIKTAANAFTVLGSQTQFK